MGLSRKCSTFLLSSCSYNAPAGARVLRGGDLFGEEVLVALGVARITVEAVEPSPYTPHPTHHTLHHTLHTTPYTPHPTPYTLHPTTYTPHPTSHTIDPALSNH